jgi:ankyrin repeat protein
MELDGELFAAAYRGDVDEVQRLLHRGADPNAVDGGWSVLHTAIEHDRPAVLRALLHAGADANRTAPKGWSPLHHAVDAEADFSQQAGTPRDLRLVAPLLEAGADVAATWQEGSFMKTPLDIAEDYLYEEAIEAIRARMK